MKKVVGLLFLAFSLNACDDGNLTQENISFDNIKTLSCANNNIIYKLKPNESLIVEIPATSFGTEPNVVGSPTFIDINPTNRVVYRFYNGTITSSNICETIPPITPIVTDEWIGIAGKIQLFTTAIKSINTTDNSTRIIGYNHNIQFKNISFSKASGTQVYETFPFGDYTTSITQLPFQFDKTLDQCSVSKQIYNYNNSEALILNIDPALINSSVTPVNAPRTGIISNTTNKLTYRLFSGLLTSSYFCNTTDPINPAVSEEWYATTGVVSVSGIVEVTTTTNGTGFKHTIVLKNTTMKKGNNDFKLGDNYLMGDLLTTK